MPRSPSKLFRDWQRRQRRNGLAALARGILMRKQRSKFTARRIEPASSRHPSPARVVAQRKAPTTLSPQIKSRIVLAAETVIVLPPRRREILTPPVTRI